MKIEVYDEKVSKKEKRVILRLVESCGMVTLVVCDQEGNELPAGNLLMINDAGALVLYTSVNSSFGLSLDGNERLRVISG